MKKEFGIIVFAAMLMLATQPGMAAPKADQGKLAQTQEAFSAVHKEVLQDLADGETYAEINSEQQREVRDALERIQTVFDQRQSFSSMSAEEKRRVLNDQESINTILTRARDDSRLVCKRERRVGSNRVETQCVTVAQRRRQQQEAQNRIPEFQRVGRSTNGTN